MQAIKKTKVINFVGGSGCGKSLMSALIFAELKMKHISSEYVQEYAKTLVWRRLFCELNNQYQVSTEQYNMIKAVDGCVDYIICDSGMIVGMFYNKYNIENVCDVKKTEEMILSKMNDMENIYIFLERNPEFPFEHAGRIQDEEESKQIDVLFKNLLDELSLRYLSVISSKDSIPQILNYILQ